MNLNWQIGKILMNLFNKYTLIKLQMKRKINE